jgi:hypothetical protein
MTRELMIDVRMDDPDALRRLRDVDIPQNVLFVAMTEPLAPITTVLTANIALPGGASVRLRGFVARHLVADPRGTGVELSLMRVRSSELLVIDAAVRSLRTPPGEPTKPPVRERAPTEPAPEHSRPSTGSLARVFARLGIGPPPR